MSDVAAKPTLEAHRAQWLYAHFQAISRASNHYLFVIAVAVAFSLAVFLSTDGTFDIAVIGVKVQRDLALSASSLIAIFTFVAYFGNYEKGEATLKTLSCALGADYEELDFVDTHPNPIDFIRFAGNQTLANRNAVDRALAAMLYPVMLILALIWLTLLPIAELFLESLDPVPTALYVTALITTWFAWRRAKLFISRRWKTFRTAASTSPTTVA